MAIGQVCPNKADPVYKHLKDKIGEPTAMQIFIDNGNRLPESIEEADDYIRVYSNQESIASALNNKDLVEDLLQNLRNPSIELEKRGRFYVRKDTGEVVSNRVSDKVSEYYRSLNSSYGSSGDTNYFYAKKGTVVHEYKKYLMDTLSKGEKPNYTDALNYVMKLKELDMFNDEPDSFFKVTELQFNVLSRASSDLLKQIKNIQNSIDKDGSFEIFTEIPVYSEESDTGGTIDVLVVFSDGSASVYDYKTFSKRPGVMPTPTKIRAWDIQMASYRQILKNDYGITKFRHQRVIPINVSFSSKNKETGKYENELVDGFQRISVYNEENNLEYLKPIPFSERTEDDKLNSLIDKIEARISTLDEKISIEKNAIKRSSFRTERARLYEVMKRLQRDLDIEWLFQYVNSKAIDIRDQIKLSKSDENSLILMRDDILEFVSEMEMFDTISSDLIDRVNAEKDENKDKLLASLRKTNTIVTETLNILNNEVIDIVTGSLGKDVGEAGEVEGFIMRQFTGLSEKTMPVFSQFYNLFTMAKRTSFNRSKEQMNKLFELDQAFRDWATRNGISQSKKFKLLLTDEKKLISQYKDEFYKRFGQIKRDAFEKNGVSPEDVEWLKENFVFDEKAYEEYYHKPLLNELEKQKKLNIIKEDEYKKRLEELAQKNAVVLQVERFKGHAIKYFVPKNDIKQSYNPAWVYIQENKELKDYYDFLKSINKEATDLLGKDVIGERFAPNVQQTFIESIFQDGFGAASPKSIWEKTRRAFSLRESDDMLGQVVDGRTVKQVPIFFTNDIILEPVESEVESIKNEVAKEFQKGTKEYKDEVRRRLNERRYELGRESKSIDLTASYSLFIQSFNDYMEVSTIEPIVRSVKYLMEVRGQNSEFFRERVMTRDGLSLFKAFTGEIKMQGITPETIKQFEQFTDRLIYKKQFDQEILGSIFSKVGTSGNKVLMALSQYLSVKTIGLDIVLSGTQAVQVVTNMLMIGAESRYFSKKNIKEAISDYTGQKDSFMNVIELFNPTSRDLLADLATIRKANLVTRRATLRTIFFGQSKPTEVVENITAVSMAKNYIVDSDGKIKNPKSKLVTIYDKNAKTVQESIKERKDGTLYIPGVSESEINKFRNKMLEQNRVIGGTLTEEQKGTVYNSVIMSMFLKFRTWIAPLLAARYRGYYMNKTMEEVEVGRFNLLFSGIWSDGVIPALSRLTSVLSEALSFGLYKGSRDPKRYKAKFDKWLEQNPQYKEKYSREKLESMFEELVVSKVNGAVSELRNYLILILLTSLARGLDWDDEEETNIFSWNVYRILEKSTLEAGFWLNPRSVNEVIRQPMPITSLVTDITRLNKSIAREVTYLLGEERDPRVKTNPFYYSVKMVPVVNQVFDFMNYFEPYQIEKSGFELLFDSLWRE